MANTEKIVKIDRAQASHQVEDHVRGILCELGEDPDREGLTKTPHRVAKAFNFLTKGYHEDLETIINGALFTEDHQEMVTLKDISLYSLCEHHLLPFFGKCHVAYIPNKKILGLSKIVRLVEMFARRLQVQERLTDQIAATMMEVLDPLGVAVVIEAEHLCMQMRGVQKSGSTMVTSAMLGAFRKRQETREEFMTLIRS
jgi:GTP cyclohydrolase IA